MGSKRSPLHILGRFAFEPWLRKLVSLSVLTGLILGFASPLAAQSSLGSTNFKMDNINFGSLFPLISGGSIEPPTISGEGPTVIEITDTSATIQWRTDKNSTSFVEYGTTTSYGQESGKSEFVTEHTVTITGLTPETAYHYRVKSEDEFNEVGTSSDRTFTTTAERGITSIRVYNISYTEAFISWKTGEFTTSQLEYGTTTAYGLEKTTESRGFLTDHNLQLTGLTAGTEYHFRIVAETERGDTFRSSDFSFLTIAEPAFNSINVTPSSANEAVVTWETNVFTTGIVNYRSDREERELSAGDSVLKAAHSLVLRNLFGETVYTFTITAIDAQGRQVTSPPRTFATLKDTAAPLISDLKVQVTRSGETLVLTATWKTNEPSKSQVSYNPKTDTQNVTNLPESATFSTDHVVISSGLLASTPYTMRALVTDAYGNQSEESINFVSPGLRRSILQLILDSILKPFGWLVRLFEG